MSEKRYNALSDHLRAAHGGPVRKVPFRIGATCPNRDGTKGTGGCTYCSGRDLVPSWFAPGMGVREQVERGIERTRGAAGYIAYLQDHTGTYCPAPALGRALDEARSVPGVVGLSVGTRPDCLPSATLDVLGRAAARGPIWVEIGLQTASDTTLAAVNRNHTAADFLGAASGCRGLGIPVVAHVILGLPGEGTAEAERTALLAARAGVAGVKLHNLLVLRGTALHDLWEAGGYAPPTLDEYCGMAVRFLEITPTTTAIHRLAADAPADLIAAPDWARDKTAVAAAVLRALRENGTRQGARAPDTEVRE